MRLTHEQASIIRQVLGQGTEAWLSAPRLDGCKRGGYLMFLGWTSPAELKNGLSQAYRDFVFRVC
jgi:hypothetical protein